MKRSVSPSLDRYDHNGFRTPPLNRGVQFCLCLAGILLFLEGNMCLVCPSLDWCDGYGINTTVTTTIIRGALFCLGLSVAVLVLDYVAYEPFIQPGMENVRVIRNFHRYSVCSITRRHRISLGLPGFLFVISIILTVLISAISLSERSLTMALLGICYLLLVILPRIIKGSLLNRSTSSITPTCRYKNSLSFKPDKVMSLSIVTGLMVNISLAERSIFASMFISFIFFIDLFPVYMGIFPVNPSSILTLNFGLDATDLSQLPTPTDLSQLPTGCLSEIVERLHSFEDVMAVSGVSQILRSACFATTVTRPHQLPWLMLSETPHTHMRRFSSLLNRNRYQLPLSKALCGKRCWGSQHNWVVALGPDYRAHLVPLVRGEPIALPPLDTIRGDAPEEWFRLAHKFILFKDPYRDHEQSFLVFAIFSPMNCLAFARVGEGATLNRRGQDGWVIVTSPDNLKFKDVACLNDQVYGLCDEGTLVRFELDAPLLPEVRVIASHEPDVREPRQLYLVESLGKLYMVFRYGYLIPSQRRHVTTSFLVYTFNFSALAFEEVRDLEGRAFFVGDGNSWSIPTSTIPAVTNRIYFTDDHWDWPMYLGGAYGGRDLGGFNMANRFMQSLPFGKVSPPSHSRPILVTPPIRLD